MSMASEHPGPCRWQYSGQAPGDADSENFRKAFEFVRSLAAELSHGRVDLPTCPQVASRVHQALDEEDLSATRMTRVIASDPGLAARTLALANSNRPRSRGTLPLVDLKLAVTRVGKDNVRSAALPYVLEKIRAAPAQPQLAGELARLWERAILVAAIARVLAIRTHAAVPDEALLAGLLHNIGSVYILARADQHLELFQDRRARDSLVHDWQDHIGKAIAQNWGLPDSIADAIGDQDQLERLEAGSRDLKDVLCVAVRAATFFGRPNDLKDALGPLRLLQRLGLDGDVLREVMDESASDVAALRSMLGR